MTTLLSHASGHLRLRRSSTVLPNGLSNFSEIGLPFNLSTVEEDDKGFGLAMKSPMKPGRSVETSPILTSLVEPQLAINSRRLSSISLPDNMEANTKATAFLTTSNDSNEPVRTFEQCLYSQTEVVLKKMPVSSMRRSSVGSFSQVQALLALAAESSTFKEHDEVLIEQTFLQSEI